MLIIGCYVYAPVWLERSGSTKLRDRPPIASCPDIANANCPLLVDSAPSTGVRCQVRLCLSFLAHSALCRTENTRWLQRQRWRPIPGGLAHQEEEAKMSHSMPASVTSQHATVTHVMHQNVLRRSTQEAVISCF